MAKQQAQLPPEKRVKAPQNVGFPQTDDEWRAIDATHPVIRTVRPCCGHVGARVQMCVRGAVP